MIDAIAVNLQQRIGLSTDALGLVLKPFQHLNRRPMVASIGTDLLTKGVNYQTKPTPFGLVSNWFTNQQPACTL
jgi:hypothetical protein